MQLVWAFRSDKGHQIPMPATVAKLWARFDRRLDWWDHHQQTLSPLWPGDRVRTADCSYGYVSEHPAEHHWQVRVLWDDGSVFDVPRLGLHRAAGTGFVDPEAILRKTAHLLNDDAWSTAAGLTPMEREWLADLIEQEAPRVARERDERRAALDRITA